MRTTCVALPLWLAVRYKKDEAPAPAEFIPAKDLLEG